MRPLIVAMALVVALTGCRQSGAVQADEPVEQPVSVERVYSVNSPLYRVRYANGDTCYQARSTGVSTQPAMLSCFGAAE